MQRLWVTVSVIGAIEYLQLRLLVVNWEAAWIAIPLLLAELLGLVHMIGFQIVQWPKSHMMPATTPEIYPNPVYVLIPTLNEAPEVLEATVAGVLMARQRLQQVYPDIPVQIIVCNDGFVGNHADWREAERTAARLDVACITRQLGGGAKAGNIRHARGQLQMEDDALLVVFDADHIPHPDFFIKTLPFFKDPVVGWVQTGQYYRNTDNVIANWADQQMLLFYDSLCPHKAAHNAMFLCGTNFVIRNRAIEEVGGFPTYSPTEDFAISLPLHMRGWRSIYLAERLSSGLGPMDMKSYLKQQSRWARGCLLVTSRHWRHLLLPWVKGLTFSQRMQYLLSGTHYLGGIRDAVFVLTPIVFLLLGVSAIQTDSFDFVLAFSLYWFVSFAAAWWHTSRYTSLWRVNMMSFGCFPALVRSLQHVLVQEIHAFHVTAKIRTVQFDYGSILPHILAVITLVLAAWVGVRYHSAPLGDVLVNVFWVAYSLVNLLGFIWLGLADDLRGKDFQSPR